MRRPPFLIYQSNWCIVRIAIQKTLACLIVLVSSLAKLPKMIEFRQKARLPLNTFTLHIAPKCTSTFNSLDQIYNATKQKSTPPIG